jgi:hypothetical protein
MYQRWAARPDCFDGRAPFYTTSSQIRVTFTHGVVTAIELSRIESVC